MINLARIFKKSKVKRLLQDGLEYTDGENKYYLDSFSVMRLFKKSYIEIYWKEIRKLDNDNIDLVNEQSALPDFLKKIIALKVKKILEEEGVIVEISPALPTSFILENGY